MAEQTPTDSGAETKAKTRTPKPGLRVAIVSEQGRAFRLADIGGFPYADVAEASARAEAELDEGTVYSVIKRYPLRTVVVKRGSRPAVEEDC